MITIQMKALTKEPQLIHDIAKKSMLAGVDVVLDFEGVDVCPSCFLNRAIGQLYRDNRLNLKNNLKVKNIKLEEVEMLKVVVQNAKRFFKEKK